MAMLILTIVVELVALGILFLVVCKRKTKYLKWILGVVAGFTQITFWYLAINYCTIFIGFEITAELAIIVFCIVSCRKKKKLKELGWITYWGLVSIVIAFGINSYLYIENIKWSDETSIRIEKETFEVQENLREFDVKFECIHNSKEERYDLYQVWSNGICKIASYSEDECKVYRLPDSSSYLPRVETTIEKMYLYNYNFDAFQEPTVEETSTEETYCLYVSEASYKEDYTD